MASTEVAKRLNELDLDLLGETVLTYQEMNNLSKYMTERRDVIVKDSETDRVIHKYSARVHNDVLGNKAKLLGDLMPYVYEKNQPKQGNVEFNVSIGLDEDDDIESDELD